MVQSMFRLDGKIAMVTGGASGIGAAIVQLFVGAGAQVLVVDRDENPQTTEGVRSLRCDITEEQQVAGIFQSVERLDILVNCAGIGMVGSVEETELEEFRRLHRVNVEGTFLMTRAAIPFLKQVSGVVLNLGSVAGMVGVKRRFAYCSTKGAVIAMTRQLAVDYPTEIRVNCIAPGTVDSPFVEAYLEKYHRNEKDKVRAELSGRQPIGRLGRPEEIAALALYLCSSEAGFVNGSVMTIDGGWTAA